MHDDIVDGHGIGGAARITGAVGKFQATNIRVSGSWGSPRHDRSSQGNSIELSYEEAGKNEASRTEMKGVRGYLFDCTCEQTNNIC